MSYDNPAFVTKADLTRTDLQGHIERAEAPDSSLDLRIAVLIGLFDRYATDLDADPALISVALVGDGRVEIKVGNRHGGGLIYSDDLPKLTASLDAALAAAGKLLGVGMPQFTLQYPGDDVETAVATLERRCGTGRSPALALCAALVQHVTEASA